MAAATFLAKHKIMHFPPSAPEADFQRAGSPPFHARERARTRTRTHVTPAHARTGAHAHSRHASYITSQITPPPPPPLLAVAKFTKMEESVIASGNKLVEYYNTIETFAGGMGAGPQAFSVACAPPGANLFSSGAAEVEYAFKQLASVIEKTILPSILKKAVALDQVSGLTRP